MINVERPLIYNTHKGRTQFNNFTNLTSCLSTTKHSLNFSSTGFIFALSKLSLRFFGLRKLNIRIYRNIFLRIGDISVKICNNVSMIVEQGAVASLIQYSTSAVAASGCERDCRRSHNYWHHLQLWCGQRIFPCG